MIGLMLVGTAAVSTAPSVSADEGQTFVEGDTGACIKIYWDPPGAAVDPENCKPSNWNETIPPPP